MSERPDNPLNQEPTTQGGWHAPREASPWQAPEQTQAASRVAWREVPALPSDVEKQPQERGKWHLPDENDTTFSPEDVVEISDEPREVPTTSTVAATRPEDLIAEIIGGTQRQAAVPNPEDFDFNSLRTQDDDGETQAADAIEEGETLLVDEGNADALPVIEDEAFSMSEYVALANLAQGDEDDLAGIGYDDMSPAQRALYNTALNTADEMDSRPINEPPVGDDATVTMDDTSEQVSLDQLTPAEAAARALQELEQQNSGADQFQGYGQQEPQEPQQPQRQYTPEEVQLAQQFRETKRQVAVLRQMANQGQIDQQELQVRLQEYSILDPQGNWWMVGYETDGWYRYNNQNGQWEEAEPPVPLDAGQARTETGLGEAAPDVLPGSLPYLPADGTQQNTEYSDQQTQYDSGAYTQGNANYANQFPADNNMVRNPNQPTNDPNMTMVSGAAFADNIGTDPTYQNLQRVDDQATMPAGFNDGQQTVQSASLGDLVYDDGFGEQQGVPAAEVTYQDDGFNDYQGQAAPDIEELDDIRENAVLQFALIGGFVIVIFGLILVGGFVFYAMNQYNSIVDEWQDEIASLGTSDFDFQTATILAADDTIIAELTGEEGARTVVSIENGDVSPWFVHAVVSSEDPRYYENPGFDVVAIGRAFLQNIANQDVVSGASTITQQIVRERVIGSNVVSFDRKLTEVLVSMEVARTYSKNEILDIYINEFFYGQQSYGVEAASDFYFDTTAAELNAAQSATLAGILPSPSSANPVVAPAEAFNRMRIVLESMVETGCLNFQHGEWAAQGVPFCVNESVLVDDGRGGQTTLYRRNPDGTFGGFLALQIAQVETRRYEPRQSDIQYPHFVFYVLGELDQAYGRGAYIERGFTVRTTIVPRIQNTAETAIRQGVDALALSGAQTGAAIVTDPTTGAILAMVGSPDFNDEDIDGQNNGVISPQQPGSAIKPVVYATALRGTAQSGYFTPATILWDVPSSYTIDGVTYTPVNFDGRYRGPVSVRNALAQSLNIPAVKTYATFNTQAFIDTANAMGIDFDPNPDDDLVPTFGLPTAVGATEVTLLDLTQAYATIANDGIRREIFGVSEISERSANGNEVAVELIDNLILEQQEQALSPQVAFLLQNILSDNTARSATVNGVPSSFPANSNLAGATYGLSNQNQLAVKTGTNNAVAGSNPSRLWTVGFTNNYAVGVWLGTLNQSTPLSGNNTGFSAASPVWRAIMTEALNGQNPGVFNNPAGVRQEVVCQLTGTLSSQASSCPNRVSEVFAESQLPPSADAGFVQTVNIDSWSGLRANAACPENVVTETYANINDPFAVNWLNSTQQGRNVLNQLGLPDNLQAAPTGECQQGQVLPNVSISFPQENTELLGDVAITGQVSADGLQRWELQISEVGTDNFRAIMTPSTSQVQTRGSVLLEWDSRSVPNGAYILRLAAFSNSGGFIFRDVRVNVSNPEPTPVPATPTPFVVEITPLPFQEDPTPTPLP